MDFSFRNIGIGSGSTVIYVVEAIASLGKDVTDKMAFSPTGDQSRELLKGAGLRLQYIQDLAEGQQLDVVFDGADEVDEELNLIKGGGACLFLEKLVVTKGKKFVCVAGESCFLFFSSIHFWLISYHRLQKTLGKTRHQLEKRHPHRGGTQRHQPRPLGAP